MNAPAFQLYASDFFVDTITWSLEELGLYARLIFIEWANGPLPSNPQKLAQIAGISPRKLAVIWPQISSKFIRNDEDKYVNIRLEETRQKQLNYSESRRKGAYAKHEKDRAHADAHAEHMDMHNGYSPTPTPTPTPTTKTKDKKNRTFIPPSIEEVRAYCAERGNGLDPELFIDKYTGNGWMVGKNKMKDWKAVVRTWEKNNFHKPDDKW